MSFLVMGLYISPADIYLGSFQAYSYIDEKNFLKYPLLELICGKVGIAGKAAELPECVGTFEERGGRISVLVMK